jgi:hypothetical protein
MPDAQEAEEEKVLINMGIAVVIPAEKITEVLSTFADDVKRDIEEFLREKVAVVQPDNTKAGGLDPGDLPKPG